MRIDRIELHLVRMPLLAPWRTAYGEDREIESLLCRISSGSVDAWGESSPLAAPCYSSEWGAAAMQTASRWLAPAVVGREIGSPEQLQRRLSIFKGNPFAKAALDNAWWSLYAAIENVPLHRALGATRETVAVGADFGVEDSIDHLLQQVGAAADAGFPRVKLKYRPGWDEPVVQAVRKQHPKLPLHIDCNAGYQLGDLAMFQRLDELQLAMFEQPLQHDDVVDHARLQQQVRTPVCLDESACSLHVVRSALHLRSCRWVNIKPGRVGGLTVARQIHDACQRAGVGCWVGGMLESATGASQCAALAMLDNFLYPADLFPSTRFYAEDLAQRPIELCTLDGVPAIAAPSEIPPPNSRRLAGVTVQQSVITADDVPANWKP